MRAIRSGELASRGEPTPRTLVMMGGPMGVYEQDAHPWIAHEIERLRDRLA